jgi:SulP family sulfate permease
VSSVPPPGYDEHDTARYVDEPVKESVRSAFARDRARVLHSAALRRLQDTSAQIRVRGAFLLLVTLAVVGARTAMITSATGSTALLMKGLVQRGEALGEGMGLHYLLSAGILTGLLQIAWVYLRLAHQMRFVPQPVTAGFVNALAILIALAQLPQLGLDCGSTKTRWRSRQLSFRRCGA